MDKLDKKTKEKFSEKYNLRWVYIISFWTFIMAGIFSIISDSLVNKLDTLLAFIVLVIMILMGIVFDIIGIAVTTAEEKPFHAMAANRVEEAKYAIRLVRNASQVSNFCNDVIGDISGIVSGAIGTTIIFDIINTYGIVYGGALNVGITSLIAAFTVGGKALGKSIAMIHYDKIIFSIAKFFFILDKKFNIEIFADNKKK